MLNIQLSPQLQAKSQKIVIGACSPKVCPHYIELNPLLPQSLFNCDFTNYQLPTAELKFKLYLMTPTLLELSMNLCEVS